MKEEFVKYLESIGITKTLRKRVEIIHEFYTETCPDEITAIFVTDYIKEDNSREYENIWFFSLKYCMEAKLFITKDDFDITTIEKRIVHWEIKKQDYDFKKSTEKSRLNLIILFDTGITGTLRASKENCDYLKDIIFKYVAPNLRE